MRDVLTTVAEAAGALSVTVGAFLIDVSFGLIVGGVVLIVGSYISAGEE